MPQELKKVNGRWVVSGSQQSSDLVPTARPEAKPAPKPGRDSARPRPKPKPKPNPFAQLVNDIRYELFGRPLNNPVLRNNPLTKMLQLNQRGGAALAQQAALGMVGATDNALRMGYSSAQRVTGKPKADPARGAFGGALDQAVDATYKALGATPPSAMTQEQREFDMTRRSLALNVALAPVSPTLGAGQAVTALGTALRGGGAFALNEALSTVLDDNTGGNVINLINQITGAKLPGAVNVGQDDMVDAAVKSFLPNAGTSLAVGGAVGGAVSLGAGAFKNIRRRIRAGRAVDQEVQERAFQREAGLTSEDEAGTYDFTEEARQPAPQPEPAAAPAPAPQQGTGDPWTDSLNAIEEQLGMGQQAPRPEAPAAPAEAQSIPSAEFEDPTQPGADMGAVYEPLQERPWDYDPSLPESTAVGKAINELSDAELAVVQQGAGMPVVERINQVIEARAQVEPGPGVSASMVMAPADRLADDYLESIARKLEARDDWELRPLFSPDANPELWARAQAITGVDDPSQLSKADMLDTFGQMVADGQAPIVNRLMGGQMLPTSEILAAPDVFQYKGGVNESGEQIGNSLSGVERWDPNAENIIQVWRSPEDGQTYVVNGHNRLAAAKRMGIPSMRVEYLDAPTAAEARLQGAISNVSDGKGTVFDAAKLAREYGITDTAQLKALGKPGASGFWKDGIALGRLPEDVFTAAVNEQIPLRRAVIIGESGVDEETMRSAYRYLVQQGPDNVKEGTLREMLAMAGRSPANSSVDQPDILTGTQWEQSFNQGLLAKADLASSVRLMLSKEKKLFGTVGRQAGQIERVGQVDAGAAKDISGEASRALAIFDQLKYETGPVGDLLNEGTQRVLAGEQPAAVAKGIKNRLAAAIQEAMGKEVAPATDVVQEDLLTAATKTADEPPLPIEMTAEDRAAAKTELIREAITNGEVRPPSAPIPRLPEPSQARLQDIAPQAQQPAIEIPAAASRPARDPARVQIAAESLYSWTSSGVPGAADPIGSVEEALAVVNTKGRILDPDAIPGLDMAAARNDKAMGRSTPATEAVAAAYRQFYGIPEPAPALQPGAPAAQAIADEVRLAIEHRRADAAMAHDQREALKDATDYEALTFDQKKELGLADDVITPEVMGAEKPPGLADTFAQLMRQMAESDARLYRATGEAIQEIRKTLDEFDSVGPAPKAADPALKPAPVKPEPLRLTQAPEQPELQLPRDLRMASPRYGRNTIEFASDLDRAAYVLANDAKKPSKSAAKFRMLVNEAGLDLADVVAHGAKVRAALKQAAKGNPGKIQLPPQPWSGGRNAGTQRVMSASRDRLEQIQAEIEALRESFKQENAAVRADVEARIPEVLKAMRKIVGDDVRVRILDTYKIEEAGVAWGNKGEVDIAGVFQLWKDTIHLYRQVGFLEEMPVNATFDDLLNTGFHEGFHRIARLALTDKDMAVLNTGMARFKVRRAMEDWGGQRRTIAYDEALTEAAARVFSARYNGKDPVKAILPMALGLTDEIKAPGSASVVYGLVEPIARILNKVYDTIERTINLIQGRGFESISSVFSRAASGEMRQTIPSLAQNRATLEFDQFPGMARAVKINQWEGRNVYGDALEDSGLPPGRDTKQALFDQNTMPTRADTQRVADQIEANNQAISEIRRKAQQEGC